MKQEFDTKTVDMVDGSGVRRQRGRPRSVVLPGVSEVDRKKELARLRQVERRQRLADSGVVSLTVNIPVEVMAALDKFLQFKDETKDQLVERVLRDRLMRKR